MNGINADDFNELELIMNRISDPLLKRVFQSQFVIKKDKYILEENSNNEIDILNTELLISSENEISNITNRILELDDQFYIVNKYIEDRNNIIVPGEIEALKYKEPIIFNFEPSISFDYKPSEIHFRIAESSFYSMCQSEYYIVKNVKYIVSPELIKRFILQRSQMEKENKEVKSILCMIKGSYDKNIIFNGIKDISKIKFSNDKVILKEYIEFSNEIMIFQILREKHDSSIYELSSRDMVLPIYIVTYDKMNTQ